MSNEIEIDIQQMLSRNVPPHEVARALVDRIGKERMNTSEKLSILNFAYNCGYKKGLFEYFSSRIERRKSLPWSLFALALHEAGVDYDKDLANHFFEAAQETDSLEDFLDFRLWDDVDPRFKPLRKSRSQVRDKEYKKRKQRLKDKILFLKNQHMIEEERAALNKFAQMFPDDPFIEEQKELFQQRWAREIIARRSTSTPVEYRPSAPKLSQKEIDFTKAITETAMTEERYKKDDSLLYSLAVSLKVMELPEGAIELMEAKEARNESEDWFLAECLIDAGRPLDAINIIHQIENKYSNNPETAFGANYLRAIALARLGQVDLAISFMNDILKIRPNYRSASSLVAMWEGGSFDF